MMVWLHLLCLIESWVDSFIILCLMVLDITINYQAQIGNRNKGGLSVTIPTNHIKFSL